MSTKDHKLGVAIHGAGSVAQAHVASWIKNPYAEIVAVSSRRRESARRLVEPLDLQATVYDSLDQVLADQRVDIVDLTGPNHVHAEQAVAAAEAAVGLAIVVGFFRLHQSVHTDQANTLKH